MYLFQRHVLEQSLHTAIEHAHLFFHWHGMVLLLDEQGTVFLSLVDGEGCDGIHLAAKLAETFQLAVLGLVDFERACHFLHGLELCIAAHAAH